VNNVISGGIVRMETTKKIILSHDFEWTKPPEAAKTNGVCEWIENSLSEKYTYISFPYLMQAEWAKQRKKPIPIA